VIGKLGRVLVWLVTFARVRRRVCALGVTTAALVVGLPLWIVSRPRSAAQVHPHGSELIAEDAELSQAPDFTLPSVSGRLERLSDHCRATTSILFFCGCTRCVEAAKQVAALQRTGELSQTVSVVSLRLPDVRAFQHLTGLCGLVLSDRDGAVTTAYQSSFCPRFWRINRLRTVTYSSPQAVDGPSLANALTRLRRYEE
jgi:hypothetical protein